MFYFLLIRNIIRWDNCSCFQDRSGTIGAADTRCGTQIRLESQKWRLQTWFRQICLLWDLTYFRLDSLKTWLDLKLEQKLSSLKFWPDKIPEQGSDRQILQRQLEYFIIRPVHWKDLVKTQWKQSKTQGQGTYILGPKTLNFRPVLKLNFLVFKFRASHGGPGEFKPLDVGKTRFSGGVTVSYSLKTTPLTRTEDQRLIGNMRVCG